MVNLLDIRNTIKALNIEGDSSLLLVQYLYNLLQNIIKKNKDIFVDEFFILLLESLYFKEVTIDEKQSYTDSLNNKKIFDDFLLFIKEGKKDIYTVRLIENILRQQIFELYLLNNGDKKINRENITIKSYLEGGVNGMIDYLGENLKNEKMDFILMAAFFELGKLYE